MPSAFLAVPRIAIIEALRGCAADHVTAYETNDGWSERGVRRTVVDLGIRYGGG